ncbi:MAG: DUF6850 family outer membrane beta-barrel protein [Ignavibacteriaceae bacterium]
MKRVIILILVCLTGLNISYSQSSRIKALGGMTLAIEDQDYLLNPFDFGGNQAYLMLDEKETHLRINPSVGYSWGDLRRAYDSEGRDIYGVNFRGIKSLGEKGTFLGYTSYNHEIRKNYNRMLTYDTYSGESFFIVDTTSGNYRYSGPRINIQYSWPLIQDLYLGVSVAYQLLDGLKGVYTYAQTIYREVDVNFGAAYIPIKNLIIGTNAGYTDFQETIEAKDVNLLEVELFNYRGDTYYIKQRGSSETQKIRKKKFTLSGQLFYQYDNLINWGIQGNYYPSNSKILIPQSGFIDVEEGYSAFESYDIQSIIKTNPINNGTAALSLSYFKRDSWSRNSKINLLLWEWNTNTLTGGAGISYKISQLDLLVGGELELRRTTADSSKHIDNRYVNETFNDMLIKFGFELEVLQNSFLRSGINFGTKEFDLLTGGKDVDVMMVTFGIGYPIFESLYIDAYVEYGSLKAAQNSYYAYTGETKRIIFNGVVSLKLKSF